MTDPKPALPERDLFEAWAQRDYSLVRDDEKPDAYVWASTAFAWELWQAARAPLVARVAELERDAARYRAFIDAGFPVTFLGVDYRGKAALDAAIDAALGKGAA